MRRRPLFFWPLALCLLLPLPAKADAPPTLAQALAAAATPKTGVALSVGAALVPLPGGATLPGTALSVSETAALYEKQAPLFGDVVAVAPRAHTVVYAPPETPNPYDGMAPKQVLKMLAATFTPSQWKAFLSTSGVGFADMSGGTQPALFQALFPGGHLVCIKDSAKSLDDASAKRDLSGDALIPARLRLRYLVSLALQSADNPDTHTFLARVAPEGAPPRFFMLNAQGGDVDREFGATVREEVPNVLKPGQINYDAPVWRGPVPLDDGVRTVDDLVARIGRAAGAELYADPRYGGRLVTLTGAAHAARACDLLRALALCVGGTYRVVGPAAVLTDDLVGLGTRHALWKDFEEKARALQPGGADDVFAPPPTVAGTGYTVQDIPWGDDPLAYTADQQKDFWKQWHANPMQSSLASVDITLPFGRLSPAQQENARSIALEDEKRHAAVNLDGTVLMQAQPELEIVLPALGGPVIVSQSYDGLLPYPAQTPADQETQRKRLGGQFPFLPPPGGNGPAAPPPDLRAALRGFDRRAARIAPKTNADLTRSLATLKALGFNEAWLEVIPGAQIEGALAPEALLLRAVKEGKAAGITVLPDLRLLRWGDGTPPALLDRDIRGLTTSEAAKSSRFEGPETADTVSPFDPAVGQKLSALVRALGSVRGAGGMVWEGLVPPGYEGAQGNNFGDPLGYAGAGRLACLRLSHADPVDLYTNQYTDERAHVQVPGFGGDFNRERALYDKWRVQRALAVQSLARTLAAALPPGPALLLVPPANASFGSVYGSWDDRRRPLPEVTYISPTGPDGQPLMGVSSAERMPSALSYHAVQVYAAPDQPASAWGEAAARALFVSAKNGEQNVVLDTARRPRLLEELVVARVPQK